MLSKERNEIISLFKRNLEGYLALNNIQEIITSITYFVWYAKAKLHVRLSDYQKERFEISVLTDMILSENEKKFILEIADNLKGYFNERNLMNIIVALEDINEEKLIDIICEDYNVDTRYNDSTSKGLSELVYKILEQNKGNKVLDICSCTGNFLTEYAKKEKDYLYTGIEINRSCSLISKIKLTAIEAKREIINENIFSYRLKEKYDKVFCEYPFGIKLNRKDMLNPVGLDTICRYGTRITFDWYFVNCVVDSMSANGKAVVVMNNSTLYKTIDAEIRKDLMAKGMIEAIISLPKNILNNTAIACSIMILSEDNKKVKFINAKEFYTTENNKNIINVEKIYTEYLKNNGKNVKIVDAKTIKESGYSLLVEEYLEKEEVQIENSTKLENVILDIFRGYQMPLSEVNQLSNKKEGIEPLHILNMSNIDDGEIVGELSEIYPENDRLYKYVIEDKDLIITSKGVTNKIVVAEKKDRRILPSGNFTVVRVDQTRLNPYYLKMFLESKKGIRTIDNIRTGGLLPTITASQLKNINVPVPPLEEQNEAVRKYLAKNDEIKVLKSKLEKLQITIQELTDNNF